MIANWRWWKSDTKWLIVVLCCFIAGCGPVGCVIPALSWGVGTSITKAIIGALITLASVFAGGFGLGRPKK